MHFLAVAAAQHRASRLPFYTLATSWHSPGSGPSLDARLLERTGPAIVPLCTLLADMGKEQPSGLLPDIKQMERSDWPGEPLSHCCS